MLQKILDTAAERNWQVTSVNLDSLTEATFIKLLTDLDYKKEFQIIIDCELERLNSIINLVKPVYSCVFGVCAHRLQIDQPLAEDCKHGRNERDPDGSSAWPSSLTDHAGVCGAGWGN